MIICQVRANVLVVEPDDSKAERTLASLKLVYAGEFVRVQTVEEALSLLGQAHKFNIVAFDGSVWSVEQAIAIWQVN
ncbi:MAG: hypothetical protein WCX71_01020 [Candidatus Buchananbacteria bacterium]